MSFEVSGEAVTDSAAAQAHDFGLQIARFVRSDPALFMYYLLQLGQVDGERENTIQSYYEFLAWFFLIGRRYYRQPLVIPESVREILAFPNADGRHPLMDFAIRIAFGRIENHDQIRAQYYFRALSKFGLGPFISRAEMRRFTSLRELARRADVVPPDQSDLPATTIPHLVEQLSRLGHARPAASLPSVSIVGFHRSVLGLGEDARSVFDCLIDMGVRPELVDASPSSLEPFEEVDLYRPFEASRPNGSVVIFCMPVFEMIRLVSTLGLTRCEGQYWIGYWPWETTTLSPSWRGAFEFVNEVWASSAFLRDVYGNLTEKIVSFIPLHVSTPIPREPVEIGYLFGSKFTFLCVFDFNSRIERKNPMGAISAFRAAFPKGTEDVQLILKTLHGDVRPHDLSAVRSALDEDDRIVLIDGALSREEICWLIQNSQVYLSLHRSEGFGRPIAEAMLLGTAVIATGWSGSADFLNEETGFPVNYRLRPVGTLEYPFAAGEWAEPDIEHASEIMRALCHRGGASPAMRARAKEIITELFSRQAVSARLASRLEEIGRKMIDQARCPD
jgi:hypothetical protein